jgi:bifunctional DNA-binding transcriptional regulator/antitoxin component of YhaV-PrlF toxin-antitoxin module
MEQKHWTLNIEEDPATGDAILTFPPELLEKAGWKEGDTIEWIDRKDGSWELKKKEPTQWVLVECVSTFRERYMVEVPVGVDQYGKDKTLWALDTVTMNEAKEFSQEHIGEQIVSHRVVTKEEALALCDKDNDYVVLGMKKQKSKTFLQLGKNK